MQGICKRGVTLGTLEWAYNLRIEILGSLFSLVGALPSCGRDKRSDTLAGDAMSKHGAIEMSVCLQRDGTRILQGT